MSKLGFYLGCAVWSYKGWVGNFYPSKTNPKDFLRLYCENFNTVEGNTTFYAVPGQKTLNKWIKEMPSGFKFCPKFPRSITHQGLLKLAIPQGLDFLETMAQLETRLGVVFLQLPPKYHPGYLEDLQEFLIEVQNNKINLAVEVRHQDWFKKPYSNQLDNILKRLNIGKVLLDTRPIYNCPKDTQANSSRLKPSLPLQPIVTADFAFVRFISHPQAQYNKSYLEEWSDRLQTWLNQGKTVYFFVHCPQEEESPNTANYLRNLMENKEITLQNIEISNSETNKNVQLRLF